MRIIGGKDCAVRGYCLSDRLWSNSMVNVIRKHPWCIFRTQYSDPRLINVPFAKLMIQARKMEPSNMRAGVLERAGLYIIGCQVVLSKFEAWDMQRRTKSKSIRTPGTSCSMMNSCWFEGCQLNTYSGDNPSNVQGRLVLGMSAGPECFRGVTLIMIHRNGICRDTFGEIYEMCGPLKSERNCPVGIHQNTLALR